MPAACGRCRTGLSTSGSSDKEPAVRGRARWPRRARRGLLGGLLGGGGMSLALWVPLLAHVPTYEGGVENCFTPPHTHTISQAIYLKGSGGVRGRARIRTRTRIRTASPSLSRLALV